MRLSDKDVYDYLHMCISMVMFKKCGPAALEIEVLKAHPTENGDIEVDYRYKEMPYYFLKCIVTKDGIVNLYSRNIETLQDICIYSDDSDCGNIFEWLSNDRHLKIHFDDEDTFVL